MNINEIITIILSSTLLATIITSSFNLFISKRKESIENIVKERKTWRDELRVISHSISKSENITELQIAIDKLKVRINAYGMAYNSIFLDSHIWELIFIVESANNFSPEEFKNIKRSFINLISCYLKYDWERAKSEIKGSTQTIVVIVSLITSFLLYSLLWFYYYNIGSGKIINYLSYTVIFILFSAFALVMISLADKWKNIIYFYALILGTIIGIVFIIFLMYIWLPSTVPSDIVDGIIRCAPFFTLIYALGTKLLAYKQNVNRFILASALSCGATKIHKKYRIFFFGRRNYTNPLTGDRITFDNFEEIIALRSTNFSHMQEESNTNETN